MPQNVISLLFLRLTFPGHMLAALAAYPELGCTGGPYEVWRQWEWPMMYFVLATIRF